jgi:tRNA 2-thiouridine synthesizing protein A
MSQSLTEAPTAALVVDARGNTCPGPLMEARKAIGNVKMGEILEVIADDADAKDNLRAWAEKAGHGFVGGMATDTSERLFLRRDL